MIYVVFQVSFDLLTATNRCFLFFFLSEIQHDNNYVYKTIINMTL